MAKANAPKGPKFVKYFGPVVEALKDLGGSGRPAEVVDWITADLNISEEEQSVILASGQSRVYNQIHWARFYLSKSGYIDSSQRGVWSLTQKGLANSIDNAAAIGIFREVQKAIKKEQEPEINAEDQDLESGEMPEVESMGYRSRLMEVLINLPASGFERLCQRLLRESGFQQVRVTGKSGDGGIDGNGLLQINPFVSFQVLFQCKRYSGTVVVSQVRDFRGAMMGRADKGIILTTGTFTKEAKTEAVRDGATPIELVDGEKLIEMLEQLGLGLRPVTSYEVDNEFFEEFRS
jgi:restriction system protein